MAKRSMSEAFENPEGYLHDVSPIKMSKSNNKYFLSQIQTERKKFVKVVCFDVNKHQTMLNASTKKTPVKLDNVQIVPSKLNCAEKEILINKRTSIQVVRKLDFPVSSTNTASGSTPEQCSLLKIKDDIGEFVKVNVSVKVLEVKTSSACSVRGNLLKKQEIIVGDATSTITLTLWEKLVNTLSENQSINISNLSVRMFNDTKTLSTTVNTEITPIEDLEDVKEQDQIDNSTNIRSIKGKVNQIVINHTYSCSACSKKIHEVDSSSQFVRCHFCNMKQAVVSLQKTFMATMNIKSNTEDTTAKVVAFTSVLTKLLTAENQLNLMDDVEEFEDFFLTSSFKINYSMQNIATDIFCLKEQ